MLKENPRAGCPDDLFRSRLDQIVDMRHELVKLAGVVDWNALPEISRCAAAGDDRPANFHVDHAALLAPGKLVGLQAARLRGIQSDLSPARGGAGTTARENSSGDELRGRGFDRDRRMVVDLLCL